MAVVTFEIPDNKLREISQHIAKVGGKKVAPAKLDNAEEEDMEVTHEVFFGENLRRLFRAFSDK